MKKVIGIVGSYRKEGVTDSVVTEVLESAGKNGADTEKIYLLDLNIEFCRNCRTCMQEPGEQRGRCVIDDDLDSLLNQIEGADALVLAAPVNAGNINALSRRFLERCVGYGYWPWNSSIPKLRTKSRNKRSVLVSSSAAPAWMGRFFSGAVKALRQLSELLGAAPVGVIWVGLVNREKMSLTEGVRRKCRKMGAKLAA